MNKNYARLTLLVIAIALGLVIVRAQPMQSVQEPTKQKETVIKNRRPKEFTPPSNTTGETDPTTSIVDPLVLTPIEIQTGNELYRELQPLSQEVQQSYKNLVESKSSTERYRAADQLWIAVKNLEPAVKRQDDWVTGVRKAHKCENCLIENGRLARPPNSPPNTATSTAPTTKLGN